MLLAGTQGLAQVLFVDATQRSGLHAIQHVPPKAPLQIEGLSSQYGVGGAVCDYDRDGHLDVYTCDTYAYPNSLWRNNGDGTFTDVAAQAGVRDFGHSVMALFLDLDNDGWDDLLVVNESLTYSNEFGYTQLYRNNGDGTFSNVSSASGIRPLEATIGGVTASDYDRDGDLDLLIVGWLNQVRHLYRNDGNFRFTDVTRESGLEAPGSLYQWSPVFADFDNDGWQDIFCAVDFWEDYLLRNDRNGRFTDVSFAAGTLHIANDMGVAVADFDNDLDLDIYTTNITSAACPEPGGCNALYVNDGTGRFHYEQAQRGIADTGWGWGTWFFDADLDGDRDLIAVSGWTQPIWHTPAKLFLNDGRGYFTDVAAAAGIDHVGDTRALLPLDFDSDGDVDFITFDVFGQATLYENRTPRAGNHFLVVRARGTTSNRNGVGARVYVTAGGRTQMHEIMVGGSFRAGPALEAHFGLGPFDVASEVRVVFPSGLERKLTNVNADQFLTVAEPIVRKTLPVRLR
jgi:hypothetical protein